MSIKHYGLDAAEIANLKAANLTDEEINSINKKRAMEQMDAEEEGIEMNDNKPAEGSLGAALINSATDSDDEASNNKEFSHIPTSAKEANRIVEQVEKFLDSAHLDKADDDAISDWVEQFYSLAMSRNSLAKNVPYSEKPFPKNAREAMNWFTE